MFRFVLLLVLALPMAAKDWYLFTWFRDNGESGVYLALSPDGMHWATLNDGKPWLKPAADGMLMRDPWLGKGPDGVWHLLWTCGWARLKTGGLAIGHSNSTDLLSWTEQSQITAFEDTPGAKNVWAPEAVWDSANAEWIVFWATTISPATTSAAAAGEKGYDHRIYAATTKDWQALSQPKLWFDPGFNCIDATVVQDGKQWVMIVKDERSRPLEKRLRLAFSSSPGGPWTHVSDPISGDWVEGPTAIRIGTDWWIYFDHYRKPQHYGALKTSDWKSFEDETDRVVLPTGQRHGCGHG